MKNILIADNRPEVLATVEPILKHWGYRALATHQAKQVNTFLKESQPCLFIIGEALLSDATLEIDKDVLNSIQSKELPVIGLRQEHDKPLGFEPHETLEIPVELFELFSFIQSKVENHPRQNLRLRLKIPGMYSIEENEFILADVLSLSMQGLFFKAPSRIKDGDRITVVFPLYGHCKEIEVKATVLYTIQPDTGNNFAQGFGVGFDDIPAKHREHMQVFIREHFLKEVSASHDGVGEFIEARLKV